jgi:hypothetical protein
MEEIQVDFEMLRQRRRKYLEYFTRDGLPSPEKQPPALSPPMSSIGQ